MYTFKRLIFVALLLFFSIGDFTADASTISAASCSLVDVQSAYNAAVAGDTVNIPTGNCTWAGQLNITKSIRIIGAGGTLTKITHSNDGPISIGPLSDLAIRVSGILFYQTTNNNGYSSIKIGTSGISSNYSLTKIRIDNNTFHKGTRAIYAYWGVKGVIDHNTFINNNIAIGVIGKNNAEWTDPIVAGTANALFIEDNSFIQNNDMGRVDPNEFIYVQEGARTVTRYNTFDGTAFTNGTSGTFEYDIHGNHNLYVGKNTDYRGSPISEVYNNIMRSYQGYFTADLRSGSNIWHHNTLVKTRSGVKPRILLKEEESWISGAYWCPGPPCPASSRWPAEDQITNSFFWENTFNGVSITDQNYTTYFIYASNQDGAYIQKDRDYFLHAPQATGGKSTYPTRAGAGDMIFSSSGANAYYPYMPYTYPHPLTKPYPPGNLRLGQ